MSDVSDAGVVNKMPRDNLMLSEATANFMQSSGVQSSDHRAALMHSGTSFGEKKEKEIRDRAFSLMMTSFKNSEAGDTEGLMQSEAL